MALRGRRHWLAIDGLGGPSYKFPQFLAASGICPSHPFYFFNGPLRSAAASEVCDKVGVVSTVITNHRPKPAPGLR